MKTKKIKISDPVIDVITLYTYGNNTRAAELKYNPFVKHFISGRQDLIKLLTAPIPPALRSQLTEIKFALITAPENIPQWIKDFNGFIHFQKGVAI